MYELEYESKQRQKCLSRVEDGRKPAVGAFWWRNRWYLKDELAWFIEEIKYRTSYTQFHQ